MGEGQVTEGNEEKGKPDDEGEKRATVVDDKWLP